MTTFVRGVPINLKMVPSKIDLDDESANAPNYESDWEKIEEMVRNYPGEQFDVVERIRDLVEVATGERPI